MKSSKTKLLLSDNDVYKLKFVKKDEEPSEGDIITKDGYKYIVDTDGIPDEEVNTILLAKQTLHLKTIKNILLFFLVTWIFSVLIIAYNMIKITSTF